MHHVDRHSHLAVSPLRDGQPHGLGMPLESVAEEIAVRLAQEIHRHLEPTVAGGRRLRQREDGVAHGDDGVARAEHHVLVGHPQGEALPRFVARQLAAERLHQGSEPEHRTAGGDRHRHGDLASLERHGGAGPRAGRRGRRLRPFALRRHQHRQQQEEEDQRRADTAVFHAGEDSTERCRPRRRPFCLIRTFYAAASPSLPLPPLSHRTPAPPGERGWKAIFFLQSPSSPGRVGVRRERRAGVVRAPAAPQWSASKGPENRRPTMLCLPPRLW